MPSHILQTGEGDAHHNAYHATGSEEPRVFAFGRRLPPYDVDVQRFIELDLRDGAWSAPQRIEVKAGDIVRFELNNAGKLVHEFRIGDPKYQRDHALMLARMPGTAHNDPNAVTLAPGASRSLVWQFAGEVALVELACHQPGHYAAGEVLSVTVEK